MCSDKSQLIRELLSIGGSFDERNVLQEAADRIDALEAALRKTVAFYDALDTPHAPGEPELLDELAALVR